MNKYETIVNSLSHNIILTFEQLSRIFIGMVVASIAILSAIPDFIGLRDATGNIWLAIALACMAASGAHTAITHNKWIGWSVLILQLVIAEYVLFSYEHYEALAYPLVTILGALILGVRHQAIDIKNDIQENKQFEREQKALDNEIKRQIKLSKSVQPTVQNNVQSLSKTVQMDDPKAIILDTIRQSGDPGATALSTQIGKPRSSIYNHYKALEKDGLITKNGSGYVACD